MFGRKGRQLTFTAFFFNTQYRVCRKAKERLLRAYGLQKKVENVDIRRVSTI
jgi:hypothetical protein